MHFLALADTLSKSVELAAQTLSDVSLLLLLFVSLRYSLKTVHTYKSLKHYKLYRSERRLKMLKEGSRWSLVIILLLYNNCIAAQVFDMYSDVWS